MRLFYKYDVAISVAEEDREIADSIVAALREKNIKCYYYGDQLANNWGSQIIDLTTKVYGNQSRYILMITSIHYVQKHWSNLERLIAIAIKRIGDPPILQLRIDDTAVDGLSQHAVYLDWRGNPELIATNIEKKIQSSKARIHRHLIAGILILLAAIVYVIYQSPICKMSGDTPISSRVKVIIPSRGGGKDSFYMKNHEVTVEEFQNYCTSQQEPMPLQPPYSLQNGPVRNVSWNQALAYCQWKKGRLPTEQEWEHAAYAGEITQYSGGGNAAAVAVYNRQKPAARCSKKPNSLNLYDMTGNVAEWCSDWYDTTYQSKAVRGGSYLSPVSQLSVSNRLGIPPDSIQLWIGFRVVWDR